jgi:hypothetical protein
MSDISFIKKQYSENIIKLKKARKDYFDLLEVVKQQRLKLIEMIPEE